MKRASALLICMVLVLTLALSAGAEQARNFLYPLVLVDEAVSLVTLPTQEDALTVTVNGSPFSGFSRSTIQDTGLPVTYYCMVDQSSSLSNDQRSQQRRGLEALTGALRPQDSVVLVTMGNSLSMGQPLSDPNAIKKAIEDACVYSSYSTALFEYIAKTAKKAAEAQSDGSFACVVLFTDGLDNVGKANGMEEALEAVRASSISFNTVSIMSVTTDKFVIHNARQTQKFAEASLGGLGSTPVLDRAASATNVEEAVAEIVNAVLSSNVLSLDGAMLPREGTLEITLTRKAEGAQQSDTVSIDAALLSPLPTIPETTVPETTAPETTVPETTIPETTVPVITRSASNPGNLLLLIAVSCLVVAVLLIVLVVVLGRRRRNREEDDQEPEFMEDDSRFIPQSSPVMDLDLDFSQFLEPETQPMDIDPKPKAEEIQPKPAPRAAKPSATSGCKVRLVPEGHTLAAAVVAIQPNETVTLGRNSKAQYVLNETDTALSGLHFELQWDSRTLYLRDRRSTNGTALNGVPLRPEQWTRVENKAVIQAGSVRYTLMLEK